MLVAQIFTYGSLAIIIYVLIKSDHFHEKIFSQGLLEAFRLYDVEENNGTVKKFGFSPAGEDKSKTIYAIWFFVPFIVSFLVYFIGGALAGIGYEAENWKLSGLGSAVISFFDWIACFILFYAFRSNGRSQYKAYTKMPYQERVQTKERLAKKTNILIETVGYKTFPEITNIYEYYLYTDEYIKLNKLRGEALRHFELQSLEAFIKSLPEGHKIYDENYQKGIYLFSNKNPDNIEENQILAKHDLSMFMGLKGHIVSVAGSRSGKGACQIIPNLLMPLESSFFVIDIKGENAAVTANYQKEIGRDVHIIDPFGEQERIGAKHNIEPSSFNPLHTLDIINFDNLFDDVTSLVESITPLGETKEPFWILRTRALLRGLILYHVTSEPKEKWSLFYIYNTIRLSPADLMTEIFLGSDNEYSRGDLASFKGTDPKDNKTFGSILETALSATEFMRIYSKNNNGVTFDPNLISQKPTTVYIVIPQEKLENYALWLRLMVSLTLNAARKNMTERRVTFLLDEFAQLGRMDNISKGFGLLAGYNITFWVFVQNLVQLKEIYGNTWEVFMDVPVKMFYKISEPFTLEYISKMLGYETKQKISISSGRSTSNSSGDKSSSNTSGSTHSTSYSDVTEPRMHSNQVAKLLSTKCISFVAGGDNQVSWIEYFKLNETIGRYQDNPLVK